MSLEDVYAIIARVLAQYTFTSPVELGDCEVVRNALLAALPGYKVGVCHRYTQVSCKIYQPDGVRIYDQNLRVLGKPVAAPGEAL